MRISSAITLLLLAGCGSASKPDERIAAAADRQGVAADDGRIPCAHGDKAMTRDCTVDQSQGGHGLELTIRHPDGAFRRLLVTHDGRGVVAADGAEPAKVAVTGSDEIEVSIGGDRYRLPATVKGVAKP